MNAQPQKLLGWWFLRHKKSNQTWSFTVFNLPTGEIQLEFIEGSNIPMQFSKVPDRIERIKCISKAILDLELS